MARLIDADELLKDNTWEWFDDWGNYTLAGQAIADAPTVDAVEVVRCKDCEYFMEDIFKRTVCNRTFDMFVMKANDFCSYGKRKIGGEREL